jgi:hypothetical protein
MILGAGMANMSIWGAGWFFMGIKQWASGRGYIYPISLEIGGCGDVHV